MEGGFIFFTFRAAQASERGRGKNRYPWAEAHGKPIVVTDSIYIGVGGVVFRMEYMIFGCPLSTNIISLCDIFLYIDGVPSPSYL